MQMIISRVLSAIIVGAAACLTTACATHTTPGGWLAATSIATDDLPRVVMRTELGDITCVIFEQQAPISASNFLRYVDEQRFTGASFYRVVRMDNQPSNDIKIEVIQGGLSGSGTRNGLPAITHETTNITGILHLDGVLSMARSRPGTASSEFFICINDQPSLDFGGQRNPDGQGFAAFGAVIDGMEIVRQIQAGETDARRGQTLVEPVIVLSIERESSN